MRKNITLISVLVATTLFSCGNETTVEDRNDINLMEITMEQFRSEGMAFGEAAVTVMEESVHFTGRIVPKLNGVAMLSAPVGGIIKAILVPEGAGIKAGEPIMEIGGNALIELQQAFVTSSARINQLESDYNRARILYEESIKTEKEFLLAEGDYRSELANYSALEMKLRNIGLDLSDIAKGEYVSSYIIRSPLNGQLGNINFRTGQYVSPEDEIAEVMNRNNIELRIGVFERDFTRIENGQKVVFSGVDGTTTSQAIIGRIGNKIDPSTNTINCFAAIDPEDTRLYAVNQYVTGEVIVAVDSVVTLPQTAILESGNARYILVLESEETDKYLLRRTEVSIGKTSGGFVEILNTPPDDSVLITGTYNIILE